MTLGCWTRWSHRRRRHRGDGCRTFREAGRRTGLRPRGEPDWDSGRGRNRRRCSTDEGIEDAEDVDRTAGIRPGVDEVGILQGADRRSRVGRPGP